MFHFTSFYLFYKYHLLISINIYKFLFQISTMNNKKGVIEMSLTLVIYLIIGFVVLGLVIGYVVTMFGNAPEIPNMDSDKLNEVCECSGNFCVDPKNGLSILKGEQENIYFKVRATDTPIECGAGTLEQDSSCGVSYSVKNGDGTDESGIAFKGAGFNAKDGESDCQVYSLEVDGSVPLGDYYIRTYIYQGTANEESNTITIKVE